MAIARPKLDQETFNPHNANVGVGTADGRYEVILWGRNLADKRTNTLVFDSVFRSSSLHTWVNPPVAFVLTPKAQLR